MISPKYMEMLSIDWDNIIKTVLSTKLFTGLADYSGTRETYKQ